MQHSSTRLIANRQAMADEWKSTKIARIAMLLKGAINARHFVGLKINCANEVLDRVTAMLPSLHNPTISHLSDNTWSAVEIVVEERVVRTLIPQLKEAGAEGIIEYPINKIIP